MREERSDAELLVAARTEPQAFGLFYDRNIADVLAFFRRRVADPELVMDLAAETFACVLGSLSSYVPGEEPARAWLYTVAHSRWVDAVRRRSVEDRARRALAMERLVIDDEACAVIERVAATGAMSLLDGCSAEERYAVLARHVDERNYEELASELQCSESVVRKRVSRGLVAVRAAALRRELR